MYDVLAIYATERRSNGKRCFGDAARPKWKDVIRRRSEDQGARDVYAAQRRSNAKRWSRNAAKLKDKVVSRLRLLVCIYEL